jgi:hypothetical protein
MTEKQKRPVKFLFQIPRGKEDRWKFYREILAEFNIEPTARIWNLIEDDIDKLFTVVEIIQKEKVKKDEHN